MDELAGVLRWVADNEGLFSGLAALTALVGICAAGARLAWLRARGLNRQSRGMAGTLRTAGIAILVFVVAAVFMFKDGEPGPALPDGNAAGPPTIAVLPFTNLSGDEQYDWLCDGMTEDIITLLAQSAGIQVIARNSTFRYKGESPDVRRVGQELGAQFVVEGSLRPVGERIRVTVQLIETGSGTHVWAEKYDRPLDEIFALQDEVTAGIAAGVGDEIFKIEGVRATQARPESLDAWGQTWRADQSWSVEDARKAIALDEHYARSHAVLGRNLSVQLLQTTRDPVGMAEAVRSARRGAELSPHDAIVLAHFGVTLLWSGEPAKALEVLERVPALSPSYAEGFAWYGDALLHNGYPAEGLEQVKRAITLTPQGRNLWAYELIQGEALMHLGRFVEARSVLRHAVFNETIPAVLLLQAAAEAVTGNLEEARQIFRRAQNIAPAITANTGREIYEFISTDDGVPNVQKAYDALEAALK